MKITITYTPAEMREEGIIEAFIKGLTGGIQICKINVLSFRGRLMQDAKDGGNNDTMMLQHTHHKS